MTKHYVSRNVTDFANVLKLETTKTKKNANCYFVIHSENAATSLSSVAKQRDADRCDVTYGDVIDKVARKNVSICRRAEQDGGLSRVYVSQSNLLHIVFTPAASAHQQQQHNFIIHVEGKNFN